MFCYHLGFLIYPQNKNFTHILMPSLPIWFVVSNRSVNFPMDVNLLIKSLFYPTRTMLVITTIPSPSPFLSFCHIFILVFQNANVPQKYIGSDKRQCLQVWHRARIQKCSFAFPKDNSWLNKEIKITRNRSNGVITFKKYWSQVLFSSLLYSELSEK